MFYVDYVTCSIHIILQVLFTLCYVVHKFAMDFKAEQEKAGVVFNSDILTFSMLHFFHILCHMSYIYYATCITYTM